MKVIFPTGIKFKELDLQLKHSELDNERFIYEYASEERGLDNWCDLIAVRNYQGILPKEALDYHLTNYLKNKPKEANYSVYSHPTKGLIWDFITWEKNPKDKKSLQFIELNMWIFYTSRANETRSIQYATRYYGNEMDSIAWSSPKDFSDKWLEQRDKHIRELERLSKRVF